MKPAEAIAPDELALAFEPGGLELRAGDRIALPGARVDLGARSLARRGGRGGHRAASQPLLRAIGRRRGTVLDATAGFGGDAAAIASAGHRVIAVERSPVVAALLADGLARARESEALAPLAARITLQVGDARARLRATEPPPDVVYIDPMYVLPRARTALPRLEIQLLRRLLPGDDDAEALLAAALESGARRVVVKRAPRAQPLGGAPAESHAGKLARYDVHHGQTAVRRPGP